MPKSVSGALVYRSDNATNLGSIESTTNKQSNISMAYSISRSILSYRVGRIVLLLVAI